MKKILSAVIVWGVGFSVAFATPITLNTAILPSAQGWVYSPSGLHAAAVETDVFTPGGSLNMNSVGLGLSGLNGGSILYHNSGAVVDGMPSSLEWTSRTLGYENVISTGQGFGFLAGFKSGNRIYQVGLSPDQVTLLDVSGFISIPVVTTNSHTYRIDAVAGAPGYDFYIDNVLEYSGTAKAGVSANDIYFGDGTGGANSNIDIAALRFEQVPEPTTLVLFSAAGAFVFFGRRRLKR